MNQKEKAERLVRFYKETKYIRYAFFINTVVMFAVIGIGIVFPTLGKFLIGFLIGLVSVPLICLMVYLLVKRLLLFQ